MEWRIRMYASKFEKKINICWPYAPSLPHPGSGRIQIICRGCGAVERGNTRGEKMKPAHTHTCIVAEETCIWYSTNRRYHGGADVTSARPHQELVIRHAQRRMQVRYPLLGSNKEKYLYNSIPSFWSTCICSCGVVGVAGYNRYSSSRFI